MHKSKPHKTTIYRRRKKEEAVKLKLLSLRQSVNQDQLQEIYVTANVSPAENHNPVNQVVYPNPAPNPEEETVYGSGGHGGHLCGSGKHDFNEEMCDIQDNYSMPAGTVVPPTQLETAWETESQSETVYHSGGGGDSDMYDFKNNDSDEEEICDIQDIYSVPSGIRVPSSQLETARGTDFESEEEVLYHNRVGGGNFGGPDKFDHNEDRDAEGMHEMVPQIELGTASETSSESEEEEQLDEIAGIENVSSAENHNPRSQVIVNPHANPDPESEEEVLYHNRVGGGNFGGPDKFDHNEDRDGEEMHEMVPQIELGTASETSSESEEEERLDEIAGIENVSSAENHNPRNQVIVNPHANPDSESEEEAVHHHGGGGGGPDDPDGDDGDDDADDADDDVDDDEDNNEVDDFEDNADDWLNEDDPDDPDEPDDLNNLNNPQHNDDDDLDAGDNNFSFGDGHLQELLEIIQACSKKEALAMCLAALIRHNLTYEALVDFFIIINAALGRNHRQNPHDRLENRRRLPTSKKLLWRDLRRNSLGQKKHAYCRRCKISLGLYDDLPDPVVCQCNLTLPKTKVCYFIEMSLKRQLERFLKRPGVADLLSSRFRREKKIENALEDVYDGSHYMSLEEEGGILSSRYNFSYIFNTDGFRVTNTSAIQVWPIYVRLNELPMNVRQKYMFLAGVWIGRGEPDMSVFLRGFVQQANRLSQTGVDWQPDGVHFVNSRFIPLCCTVDAKARCIILNLVGPTGYYACNFCTIVGVQANGVKFPILPHPQQEVPPVPRTDQMMREDMENAFHLGVSQHGLQGLSALINLLHFDLVSSMSSDDLHPIFEGVVKHHMTLLLEDPDLLGTPQKKAIINGRLTSIKVPTLIARTARDLTNMAKWRGHEWRNWLLYYSVPCLQGQLNQRHMNLLKRLCRGTFLVMRDAITPDELDEAEHCFLEYQVEFERLFGVENMRYNVHMLSHIVEVVRRLGPLYVHSTSNFESWNLRSKQNIKSMNDPHNQFVTRHLIENFIVTVPDDPQTSPLIRITIQEILDGVPRKEVTIVNGVQLLGAGVRRLPTQVEARLLQEKDIACDFVEEFTRAIHHRTELRSVAWTLPGKNDNTNVYTWNDMFGCIQTILKVENQNGVHVLILIQVYNTHEALQITHHIAVTGVNQEPVFDILNINDVRVFAVKIASAGRTYIMPMANSAEID